MVGRYLSTTLYGYRISWYFTKFGKIWACLFFMLKCISVHDTTLGTNSSVFRIGRYQSMVNLQYLPKRFKRNTQYTCLITFIQALNISTFLRIFTIVTVIIMLGRHLHIYRKMGGNTENFFYVWRHFTNISWWISINFNCIKGGMSYGTSITTSTGTKYHGTRYLLVLVEPY